MTKSFLNIGLLATTVFLCSFGTSLAIPVSLLNNETSITIVNNATTHDLHHDANASLTVNTTKSEIDYESEQWRDGQSDHGYKHDMMMPHPVSGRKLLSEHDESGDIKESVADASGDDDDDEANNDEDEDVDDVDADGDKDDDDDDEYHEHDDAVNDNVDEEVSDDEDEAIDDVDTDSEDDLVMNDVSTTGRRLLRWKRFIPKPIRRIFSSPKPAPRPAPAPRAVPAPAPRAVPAPAPRAVPAPRPAPAPRAVPAPRPAPAPRAVPAPAPRPVPKPILKAAIIAPTIIAKPSPVIKLEEPKKKKTNKFSKGFSFIKKAAVKVATKINVVAPKIVKKTASVVKKVVKVAAPIVAKVAAPAITLIPGAGIPLTIIKTLPKIKKIKDTVSKLKGVAKLEKVISKAKEIAPKLRSKVNKVVSKFGTKTNVSPNGKKIGSAIASKVNKIVPKIVEKVKNSKLKIKGLSQKVKKIGSKIASKVKTISEFKLYGNYCGPNYCGGQKFKGAEGPKCRWGVASKDSLDSCCKLHDQCCGTSTSRGTNCNREILSCVNNATCKDAKCKLAQATMKLTFSALKNNVCGDVMGSKKKNSVTNIAGKTTSVTALPNHSSIRVKPTVISRSPSKNGNPYRKDKPVAAVAAVATDTTSTSGGDPVSASTPDVDPVADTRTVDDNSAVSGSGSDADAATIPKESVVNEIFDTIPKTNGHLDRFQTKVKSILTEINSEQVRIESENRNNFNGASVTLKNEQVRLEASRKHMKMLYDESERLNATIQRHYKKLIADTDYLQVLDAMRPAFLKSLGELASHVRALKTTVDQKIVKDEYKDEMITLLTGVHMNTQNISGYVATAFINHYNKYKGLLRGENADYAEDLKRLGDLANEYKIQAQKTKDLENERLRIQDGLTKFRDSLNLSVSQREEFATLIKEIVSIFDRKTRHC